MSFNDQMHDSKEFQRNIRGLALEGGGICGLGHLGLVKYFEEKGILDSIDYFSGASAGAMTAGILACRAPVSKLTEGMIHFDFNSLENSTWLYFNDVYRLWNEYGLNNGKNIEKEYGKLLEKYVGDPEITFGQAKERYGTTLVIPATSWTRGTTIYYSPENSPEMKIKEAVRQSANYPVDFSPAKVNNDLILDGGMLDNYPIRALYQYLPEEQVIGSKLVAGIQNNSPDQIQPSPLPKSLKDFLKGILRIYSDNMLKLHVKNSDWERTIKINVGQISTLDFDLSEEQKTWLIDQGYAAAQKFFMI